MFLLLTLSVTVIGSVVILNKYIDFASSVIEKKKKSDTDLNSKVVYFDNDRRYNKRKQEDIIIDIPFTEVKVVKNDRTDHNYNKHNRMLLYKKD